MDGAVLDHIKALRPHVVVADLGLPEMRGLRLARTLTSLVPPVSVILLTRHKEECIVNAALDAGVKGYLLKENSITEIIHGIKAVVRGEVYLCPNIQACLLRRAERALAFQQHVSGLAALTPTERVVLRLLAGNVTTPKIAQHLHISPRTVETHRAHLCRKLELHGPHRLLQFALEHKSEL